LASLLNDEIRLSSFALGLSRRYAGAGAIGKFISTSTESGCTAGNTSVDSGGLTFTGRWSRSG
jgi:hypothetical protein